MRALAGRTALITGASGGLGAYIARALARERMHLALAALPSPKLEALTTVLQAGGVRAVAIATDVTERSSLEALAAEAERALGGIDVLVNNAGIGIALPYHEQGAETIARTIDVNLTAPMLLTASILPGMLSRRRGHVVNVSSVAGKAGPPFTGAYGATKAGLIAFTESLRAEYRGSGVSASAVCPGFVSRVGMYAQLERDFSVKAPRLVGTSPPEVVAAAVVRAIRTDAPEIIVNPGPVRLISALSELVPSLGEWLTRRSGANDLWRRAAEGERHRRAAM